MGLLYIDGAYTWRSPRLPSQLFDPIQHHHQFGGLLTYPDHDEAVAVGMDVVIGVQRKRRTRVLAVPKRLRPYLLYNRALLGDLSRVAARTITAFIRTTVGD